jgi:hypothetical protein
LERAELDHDGLRPTDLSARIGATMRAVHPLAKNPSGETVRIGAD